MIFEPLLTGHRVVYVQTLITYLSELGREVVVVLPRNGRTTKEFATVLESLTHVAQYEFTIPEIQREGPQRLKHVRELVRSVRKHSPSLVVIPTADYLAQWCVFLWCLAWSRTFWSTRIHANMIALPFGYPIRSFRDVIKRVAYGILMAATPIRRTTTIDEINIQKSWPFIPAVTRMKYAPEPIPFTETHSKELERQRLKLPIETKLIGIVGTIDERKELGLLLAAAKHAKWPVNASVVLAGPVAATSRQQIAESGLGARLIVHDRFLPEDDVMRYIKALDCIWLVYKGHEGPSATLVKALALGTHIVAQKNGWIGAMAAEIDHGLLVVARNPNAIAQKIVAFLGANVVAPQKDLLVRHQPSNFATAVTGLMVVGACISTARLPARIRCSD